MGILKNLLPAGLALALSACAIPENIAEPATTYDNEPTQHILHCTSAGCATRQIIVFTPAEWTEIGGFFKDVKDAAAERHAIELAMSRYEQIAGPKDGTQNDKGGTGLGGSAIGQLDCFAEAANTGTALSMMQKSGFLKFHRALSDQPTLRGLNYGTFGFVHASATIQEISDGHLWVVDTWYFDNGGPSFVVDRGEWRGGWSPEGGAGF